jgi:hypothetical protein
MKLSRLENAWAKAALSAMFPGSPETGFEGIAAMDVSGYLDDVMRTRPFKATLGLRAAIWLVALAPLFALGRMTTIVGLAPPDRERLLDVLLASRAYSVRMLAMLLKAFGALLYGGNERVRARLRLAKAPPLIALVALRLRASAGSTR